MIEGVLLPAQVLHTSAFGTLSTFVAVNTVMFTALAVAKLLPRLHPGSWFRSHNQRAETRSIYPDHVGDLGPRGRPRRRR
ncbi:MAG: hypothetical protein FWD11_04310 [Micrococcales bacterium]|nr:hypothetical protein [Micrococcales bacterium]